MTDLDIYSVNEIDLIYRRTVKPSDRPKISKSESAYKLFRENWNDLTINLYEEFKIMLLDRSNRCLGISLISSGGISGTFVDAKLVFATALKACCSGLILAHNHPSSNTQPSQQDIALTRKLREAGKFLDIAILDHLIITDDSFYSFADHALLP